MSTLAYIIIACEISFWLFIVTGLVLRYILKRKRLGKALLYCTPLIDLVLLTATVIDIRGGAAATAIHGLAAVYIGISVAFGPQMVRWADGRFAHRFAGGGLPSKAPKFGSEHARRERSGWYRHLMAWAIGCGLLAGMVIMVGDAGRTGAFVSTAMMWTIVLAIDFAISFSYTLWPRREPS